MKFENILSVISGLTIFLYGMEVMGNGFKHMAGNSLQSTLEKLTKKPVVALLAGTLITALVQSSGATTSMLVSFVNAGIMKVAQTVYVIMGANIGTTITGHLMALDVGLVAPFLAFIGVCCIMFVKQDRINAIGEIMMGLGFVFIGMDMMSGGLKPLQSSPFFLDLMVKLHNPMLGIMVGFAFTSMVQSSSASLGIIQSLAKGGLVQIGDVMFFNLGQKVGACTTAMLASLSFNRDAKRVSMINLVFNILGAAIFSVLYLLLPFDKLYEMTAPGNPVSQIANMHTIVSIFEALIFFPLSFLLTKIAYMLIPEQGSVKKMQPKIESTAKTESNANFNIFGLNVEIDHMFDLVETGIQKSIVGLLEHHSSLEDVEKLESEIDLISKGIDHNLSLLMASNINMQQAKKTAVLFSINVDLGRMADHAMNIAQSGNYLTKVDKSFSLQAYDEISEIAELLIKSMDAINHIVTFQDTSKFDLITSNEEKIDELCLRFRNEEIRRMQENLQGDRESSVVFTELLIDFERIGDHIMNIAEKLYEGIQN